MAWGRALQKGTVWPQLLPEQLSPCHLYASLSGRGEPGRAVSRVHFPGPPLLPRILSVTPNSCQLTIRDVVSFLNHSKFTQKRNVKIIKWSYFLGWLLGSAKKQVGCGAVQSWGETKDGFPGACAPPIPQLAGWPPVTTVTSWGLILWVLPHRGWCERWLLVSMSLPAEKMGTPRMDMQ
jgi:hypothetical protein